MGRAAAVAVTVLAVFVLGACGSSHKSSPPPTSSTVSTTTEPPSSTSSTTTTTSPRTTTTNPSNRVRISGFTVSPSSPISCNAPTEIELKWTASVATSVVLSIDGSQFATYKGGAQDHLEPFACDGRSHTYVLTAHAGSATAIATQVVTSKTG